MTTSRSERFSLLSHQSLRTSWRPNTAVSCGRGGFGGGGTGTGDGRVWVAGVGGGEGRFKACQGLERWRGFWVSRALGKSAGNDLAVVVRASLVIHALLGVDVGNCAESVVVLWLRIRAGHVCRTLGELLEGDPLLRTPP